MKQKFKKQTSLMLASLLVVFALPMTVHAVRKTDVSQSLQTAKLNVTSFIQNTRGSVIIKDALRVVKNAVFKKNVTVEGNLAVTGTATFGGSVEVINIDFASTDLSTLDTSAYTGGEVYYNESDDKLYLWNGTAWVDLSEESAAATEYTAGDGLALSEDNEFTLAATDCTEGQVLKRNDGNTAWECADDTDTDTDTDTNTTYTAGTGLTLTGTIFSADLGTSIATAEIEAGAITTAKIAIDAVGTLEIIDSSITSGDFAGGSVNALAIATGAVESDEILDSTIISADIGEDVIGTPDIATNGVATSEILDDTIDFGDISDAPTLDAATTVALGANQFMFNLDSTGEFAVQDGGADVFRIEDAAGISTFSDDVNFAFAGTENVQVTSDPAADTAAIGLELLVDGEDTTGGGDEGQIGLALTQSDNTTNVDEAADALLRFANVDGDDAVGAGILFAPGAAGTDFTAGIDFDLADLTTEIILENAETITNQVDGTIALSGAVTAGGDVTVTGNVLPEAAGTRTLGSTSGEWASLYMDDDTGINLGLDQDALLVYDETGDDRVELTGPGAGLYIEDKVSLGRQTLTMVTAGAATENLTVSASYVEVTGQDNASDIVQIQTTGVKEGDMLIITNLDATAIAIDQTATTKIDAGADVALTQYDVMMLIFDGTNWLQVGKVAANS